jgi:hypothetical protein
VVGTVLTVYANPEYNTIGFIAAVASMYAVIVYDIIDITNRLFGIVQTFSLGFLLQQCRYPSWCDLV